MPSQEIQVLKGRYQRHLTRPQMAHYQLKGQCPPVPGFKFSY